MRESERTWVWRVTSEVRGEECSVEVEKVHNAIRYVRAVHSVMPVIHFFPQTMIGCETLVLCVFS